MPPSIEFLNVGGLPRPAAARSSHATVLYRTVYVAAMAGVDPKTGDIVDGGIEKQTERAMRNIALCLEKAGSDLSKVIQRRLYLVDIARDLAVVDRIWTRWVEEPHPATTAVQVAALAKEGALIEIEVTAAA